MISNLDLNTKSKSNKSIKYLNGSRLATKLGLTSQRFHNKKMSSKAKKLIDEVKLKHFSSFKLEDWQKYNYYQTIEMEEIYKKYSENIQRIDYKQIDYKELQEKYERQGLPVIITGLADHYFKRQKYWTWEQLYKRYKHGRFKVGEDDKGRKLRIKMKHYLEYLVHQEDDRPLYLFESSLERQPISKEMLNCFRVPSVFRQDVFDRLSEKSRPPHRWFLIGPVRSGSTVHQDPLHTSAWNTSLQGHKLWVLMSSLYPKSIVKCKHMCQGGDDEALKWFETYFVKLREGLELTQEDEQFRDRYGVITCVQRPGETILVPGGVWHAVLNLDNTMAITQNFCSQSNFGNVWRDLRKNRPKLSEKLLKVLKEKSGRKFREAEEMNEKDGFVMYSKGKEYFNKRKRGVFMKEYQFLEDRNEISRIENKKKVAFRFQKNIYSDTSNTSSSSSSSSSSESSDSSDSSARVTRSRSRSRD